MTPMPMPLAHRPVHPRRFGFAADTLLLVGVVCFLLGFGSALFLANHILSHSAR